MACGQITAVFACAVDLAEITLAGCLKATHSWLVRAASIFKSPASVIDAYPSAELLKLLLGLTSQMSGLQAPRRLQKLTEC